MTTQEMRSYASSKGIKVIGLTNEKLLKAINLPEVDDEVTLVKKKGETPIKAKFKGYFKCPKTKVFYAKLLVGDKKRMIKQLAKVEKA